MTICEMPAERLTLHAWGELGPEESRAVEAHVASCEGCTRELDAIAAMIRDLDPVTLYPREHEVDWERFASDTIARVRREENVVPFRRPAWARPAALARAAAVVLTVGLGALVLTTQPRREAGDVAAGSALPEEFQERLEVNVARAGARAYLAQGKVVLLNVLEMPVRCSKNQLDITAEREKSVELLRRKLHLRDDLSRPELARAAELCNQLEGVLTEISTLEDCADLERIQELRDAVRRNQLLMKIGVMEGELGGFRA